MRESKFSWQMSEELEGLAQEVEEFDISSNILTNTEIVSDSKDKTSNLEQDIGKAKEIIRDLEKIASKSNNKDTVTDDIESLIYNLKQLFAEQSRKDIYLGKAQPPPSSSTDEQVKTFASLEQKDFSKRFDEIIRDFKKSIRRAHCCLNQLERDELVNLIIQLRSDLFLNDPSIPPAHDISHEDDQTQNKQNGNEIQQHLPEQPNEHDQSLKPIIADRQAPTLVLEQTQYRSPVADRVVQVVLGIMLTWTLITIVRNQ